MLASEDDLWFAPEWLEEATADEVGVNGLAQLKRSALWLQHELAKRYIRKAKRKSRKENP
jgi:hypothetical protein